MANEGGASGRAGENRGGGKGATEQQAETLQAQVEALKADLAGIRDTLAGLLSAGLAEGRESLRGRAEEMKRHGQEQAEMVMESAVAYGEALEEKIVRNPFAAVLAALGLGYLVGLMTRR
jgi:ElaB/YqjD/DUF883 family membrane-anchored ribosome-binding protein